MTTPNQNPMIPGIDYSGYSPPGIFMNPQPGPLLGVSSSQPMGVGIIGQAVGLLTYTDTLVVPSPAPNTDYPANTSPLTQVDITPNSLSVIPVSLINPVTNLPLTNTPPTSPYELGRDYVLVPSPVPNAPNLPADQTPQALSFPSSTTILPGTVLQVSYTYGHDSYYQPQTFYSYTDVAAYYGNPWTGSSNGGANVTTTSGLVTTPTYPQSELSLAAQFAFLNGARLVVCVAVGTSGGESTPSMGDYQVALSKLEDNPNVAIVVPATGMNKVSGLETWVKNHVDSQSGPTSEFQRRAIIALDGAYGGFGYSTSAVSAASAQRIALAQEVNDSRVMVVSPSVFTYYAPELGNQLVSVGGQFVAASLAGMTLAMNAAQPLTRKLITGWKGVTTSVTTTSRKNIEAQAGLCIVEQNRLGQIWVRQGVTSDFSSVLTREWSIIGQQDAMMYALRDYLNAANLIGQPVYPYTLANVKGTAEAALQALQKNGVIVDYTGLGVRQLLTNPDVLEIRFNWLPAFPLNYIVVTFSVSLTTGSINSVGDTANQANVTSSASPSTSGTQASGVTAPQTPAWNDFGGPSNTLASD